MEPERWNQIERRLAASLTRSPAPPRSIWDARCLRLFLPIGRYSFAPPRLRRTFCFRFCLRFIPDLLSWRLLMTSTRVSEIADRNYNDTENSSAPGFSSHAYSDAVSMVDSSKSRELAISLAHVLPMRSAACCHESALAPSHSSRNRGLRRRSYRPNSTWRARKRESERIVSQSGSTESHAICQLRSATARWIY